MPWERGDGGLAIDVSLSLNDRDRRGAIANRARQASCERNSLAASTSLSAVFADPRRDAAVAALQGGHLPNCVPFAQAPDALEVLDGVVVADEPGAACSAASRSGLSVASCAGSSLDPWRPPP